MPFFVLFGTNFYYIWFKFSIINIKIYARTAPSKRVIWDNIVSTKALQKAPYLMPNKHFFGANAVQI